MPAIRQNAVLPLTHNATPTLQKSPYKTVRDALVNLCSNTSLKSPLIDAFQDCFDTYLNQDIKKRTTAFIHDHFKSSFSILSKKTKVSPEQRITILKALRLVAAKKLHPISEHHIDQLYPCTPSTETALIQSIDEIVGHNRTSWKCYQNVSAVVAPHTHHTLRRSSNTPSPNASLRPNSATSNTSHDTEPLSSRSLSSARSTSSTNSMDSVIDQINSQISTKLKKTFNKKDPLNPLSSKELAIKKNAIRS